MPRELSRLASKFGKQNHEWLKSVDAVDFLERLKVDNIRQANSDEIEFSCPFPGHAHGDETPSAYMNNGTKEIHKNTAFKCWGCGKAGNAITFYSDHEGVSRMEATNVLREVYAPNWRAPKGGTIRKEFELRQKEREALLEAMKPKPLPVIDPALYKPFLDVDGKDRHIAISYMQSRGFSERDFADWNIGYDLRSHRITIPVYDPDGNLVGVKARAWKKAQKPKYMILGGYDPKKRKRYGFQPYEKSRVLFGLDRWGEQETYVFVEGEIDVMSLWKMGIPAVCTGSAQLSYEQEILLRQNCDEVILFLDDDKAGVNALWGVDDNPGIISRLEPFLRVKMVGKHKYDPNDYLVRGEEERVHRLIEKAKPSFKIFSPTA